MSFAITDHKDGRLLAQPSVEDRAVAYVMTGWKGAHLDAEDAVRLADELYRLAGRTPADRPAPVTPPDLPARAAALQAAAAYLAPVSVAESRTATVERLAEQFLAWLKASS